MSDNDIVGHKTFSDGKGGFRHEPLTRKEADALHQHFEEQKRKRAEDMPTDQDAVNALWRAWYRLQELGWEETRLAPAGVEAQIIELGSSGIHLGTKDPDSETWWIASEGDLWPSRPVLFKPIPATRHESPQSCPGSSPAAASTSTS